MEPYKKYLASHVLNDGNPISYREVSRAMKVHVNQAKGMLSDFYRYQSRMKPGSIHATYLVTGTRKYQVESETAHHQSQPEDEPMQSSPFNNGVEAGDEEDLERYERVVLLLGEEELEASLQSLEGNPSYHIYSLQPGPLKDLQVLTECNRRINNLPIDPKQLTSIGAIFSPDVKRRDITARPVQAEQQKSSTPFSKPGTQETKSESRPSTSGGPPSASQTPSVDTKPEARSSTKKQVKRDSSNFFKSFSKAKPVVKETEAPVKYASDDEDEDDEDPVIASSNSRRRPKEEKTQIHENLRKMMDQEDEPMKESPDEESEERESEDEPEEEEPVPKEKEPEEIEEAPKVEVSGGRRRGKRKIIKTKTYKDEDGFIVTKDEPAWESFSEEDVPAKVPSRPKPTAPQTSKSKATGKPKGGDISSFFKRK